MPKRSLLAGARERRLARALRRVGVHGPHDDRPPLGAEVTTRRLRELAATLQTSRPHVVNDSSRAKKHARNLAAALSLDEGAAYDLTLAAELHDVGKAMVSRETLYTRSELDHDDKQAVDSYADLGAELTGPIERPSVTAAIALQTERFDGTGPTRVGGENLPLLARALGVVTAYVAMTSKRPYRDALDREHAIAVLRAQAGPQFDPSIVETFVSTLPSRRTAIAAAAATSALTRPVRGVRLAYQRHGRVSTASITALATAVVVIGASGLAPDGISKAIGQIGWPSKANVAAPVLDEVDQNAAEGDRTQDSASTFETTDSAVTDEVLGTRYTNEATTRTTEIERWHRYWVTTSGETESFEPGEDDGEVTTEDGDVEEYEPDGGDEEEGDDASEDDGSTADETDDGDGGGSGTTGGGSSGNSGNGKDKNKGGGGTTDDGDVEEYEPDGGDEEEGDDDSSEDEEGQ